MTTVIKHVNISAKIGRSLRTWWIYWSHCKGHEIRKVYEGYRIVGTILKIVNELWCVTSDTHIWHIPIIDDCQVHVDIMQNINLQTKWKFLSYCQGNTETNGHLGLWGPLTIGNEYVVFLWSWRRKKKIIEYLTTVNKALYQIFWEMGLYRNAPNDPTTWNRQTVSRESHMRNK